MTASQPTAAEIAQSASADPKPAEPSISDKKRKLSVSNENGSSKKSKPSEDNVLRRDREHARILASNFPDETSEDQIRYFFKDCGTIKHLENENSGRRPGKTVIIEFEKEHDAATALTRNLKTFKGREISIEMYVQTVLWVTNYPADYDQEKLRNLFSEFGIVKDIRFPSLTFNTKRRFAYVQFETSDETIAALAADGRKVDETHTLIVKISDPEIKETRDQPAAEGRELFIVNIDYDATENDVRQLLSQYGNIQALKLLSKQGAKGHNGRGFVIYQTKPAADTALALDGTKFMSRNLKVQRSDPERAAQLKQTKEHGRGKRDGEGIRRDPSIAQSSLAAKTIGIIGFPDTVNETRIRTVVPDNVRISKVELKPENEGAIIEFESEADAGKAAMAMDGLQFSDVALRVVTVRELKQHRPSGVLAAPATSFLPSSVKFGAKRRRGGKR